MSTISTGDVMFERNARICRFLDKYVSDRIWTDPYLECRVTTRPALLNSGREDVKTEPTVGAGNVLEAIDTYKTPFVPLNGVLYGSFEQIALPDDDGPFYVYSLDAEQTRAFKLNVTEWTRLTDRCNGTIVSFRVFTGSGLCLPRYGMYICQSHTNDTILLAISEDVFKKCYGEEYGKFDTEYVETEDEECDPNKCYYTKEYDEGKQTFVYPPHFGKPFVAGTIYYEEVRTYHVDPSDIYMTTYIESDTKITDDGVEVYKGDNFIENHFISGDDIYSITRRNINPVDKSKLFAIWNGHLLPASYNYMYRFELGDYLEYVSDEDVIDTVILNREDEDDLLTAGGKKFMVVHTPRSKNPRNYLITPGMCDMFIQPTALEDNDKNIASMIETSAIYLRQAGRPTLFKQMTFNDFCMDVEQLDEIAKTAGAKYHDYVETEDVTPQSGKTYYHIVNEKYIAFTGDTFAEGVKYYEYQEVTPRYTLKVFVRHHTKKLGLVRDSNYVDLLYSEGMTDETILKFLRKTRTTEPDNESFWFGSELVDSPYGQAMNRAIPKKCVDPATQCATCKARLSGYCPILAQEGKGAITDRVCYYHTMRGLRDYIDILGYFNTLQLICKRITTYKLVPLSTKKLTVTYNGVKYTLNEEDVHHTIPVQVPLVFSDLDADKFKPIVYLNGYKLNDDEIESVTEGPETTAGFMPVYHALTSRPNDRWMEDRKYLHIKLKDTVEVKTGDYVTVELVTAEAPSDYKKYEMDFDIQYNYYDAIGGNTSAASSRRVNRRYRPIGSNTAGSTTNNVYNWKVDGISTAVKNLGTEFMFLNGRHLVRGLDHVPFTKHAAAGSGTTFYPTIQNVSYLEELGNRAELITTTETIVDYVKGFALGDIIRWRDDGIMWLDSLSLLVVDGVVQQKFAFQPSIIDLDGCDTRNGSPYMVRTVIPRTVKELFDVACGTEPIMQNDRARWQWLHSYFSEMIDKPPYMAVIQCEYMVYSTYLSAIIRDTVNGKFDFDMLADKDAFKAQFSGYDDLKITDVVYSNEKTGSTDCMTPEDLKFADVYPIYYNPTLHDTGLRRKINYMVRMLMPSDPIRHVEHINGY